MTRVATGILLIYTIAHAQSTNADVSERRLTDLRFSHLTARDGLAMDNVVSILQDRKGFMWFGTGDGLHRYDGNSFVVYKNNPSDPRSLSANFVRDLVEDERGHLWLAVYPGVNEFDPTTERAKRYVPDPKNPNSLSGDSVWSLTRDSRGRLWFATADSGLDRFDPAKGSFTHFPNDSSGQPLGWLTRVIEDRTGDIWFVGERGLFHLKLQAGQTSAAPELIRRLSADDLYEDKSGDLWLLAHAPIVGLIKYERQSGHVTQYPLGWRADILHGSRILAAGENGFWTPSSLGLSYFDCRSGRFTRLIQHDKGNPDGLSDNSVAPLYRDRSGLIWVGTQNAGLNTLDLKQEQINHYVHQPGNANSLSPGKVTTLYEDSDSVLWVGVFPRALDRVDRKTGKVTHYRPSPDDKDSLSRGSEINSILRDTRGNLWVGGWGTGLDRLDERTGKFQHYKHDPADPDSLQINDVVSMYADPNGDIWVGVFGGVSRFDPATARFKNYRPGPPGATSLAYTVSAIYRDLSGTLWLGTWGGILSRYEKKTDSFFNYTPDLSQPDRLQGGSIGSIHEDGEGNLWLASGQGVYRFDRKKESFTRFTEVHGLPNVDIMGILDDVERRLWISTKKGISRYDPRTGTFRNYDVSDGLRGNDFARSCYQRGRSGELFFCGPNGVTFFHPYGIHDNPYVPPVVITSFRIFNKSVPIGPKAVLKKAIPYADSLTIPYRDNVFSFEFAALSYASSRKNRYRYKLEGFDRGWNEVDSTQRLATYTNLNPSKYVFRVQGSNGDGIWNEEGVSLPVVITPPWYLTRSFVLLCAGLFLTLLWAVYQLRVRQLKKEFKRLQDVIETIPGYVWSALPDGRIDFVNKQWLEFAGVSLEQALGWGWTEAIHPDDRPGVLEAWRAAFTSGQPLDVEARVRRADGQYRWLLIRNVPLHNRKGKIVKWYGKSTDIDDRKRAEEERERLRQLEAELAHINRVNVMGELSASIAHEVNQPLTGIVSNGSACLRFLAGDAPNLDEARDAVRDIVRDGKRAGEVIARIRGLTKRVAPVREELDLNETIRDVLAIVADEARRNGVVIHTRFAEDLAPVLGDRVQLQQVLLNLVMNANEAMGSVERRQLRIATRNIDAGLVQVTVEDSGVGVDPDAIAKIFEPFHTTKSGGMGMGLSISRSIVQNHCGRLWATPNEGPGTSFHFTLARAYGAITNERVATV